MLEPLAPTSRAATILGDGGPSALEVAYKRKGIEADIGKTLAEAEKNKAAAKAADDKNKIEQQKQFDLLPDTAKLPHTELFADIYNQEADNMAAILERNGGIVPLGGEDGREFRRSRQRIKQLASNSEQLDKEMLRQLAVVDANPDKFQPGTRENIIAIYSQPDWLTKGVLPTNVLEDHFDVSGYLTPLFEKIKADQTAYGGLTAEGGTEEGTRKFILRDDIKQVAEMGAADEVANAALRRQFANFSPETQARLKQIAKDNKITQEAATALELGIGLVEYEEKTRDVTAPSSVGYGRQVEEAGRNWLTETMWGEINGTLETPLEPVTGDPRGWAIGGESPTYDLVGGKLREGKAFVEWPWETQLQLDAEGMKNYKTTKTVKRYVLDDKNKVMILEVGPVDADPGDSRNKKTSIRYDEVEGKFLTKLGSENAKTINEKGKYSIANEKAYGTSETGSMGKNPTIKPEPQTPKNETAAERYARIKAGGK